MKAKELKDALNSCHVLTTEKENMAKSLDDLKNSLSEKEKALRLAENERDLLEKEKVLFDSQIKVSSFEMHTGSLLLLLSLTFLQSDVQKYS